MLHVRVSGLFVLVLCFAYVTLFSTRAGITDISDGSEVDLISAATAARRSVSCVHLSGLISPNTEQDLIADEGFEKWFII